MTILTQWLVGLALASGSPSGAQLNGSRHVADPGLHSCSEPEMSIPADYLQAVDFLLAHGFADPRGGVLSRATIAFVSEFGPALTPTDVVGWLMPEQKHKPRQIVLANGLSYDVLSVKGPVNANELELPSGISLWQPTLGQFTGDPVPGFLLRGETKLASAYFNRFPNHGTVMSGGREDYFEELAKQYIGVRFRRALMARMAGDDRLALSDAENLRANRDAFEREWLRLNPTSSGFPSFEVLNNVDYLAADSKLRLGSAIRRKVELKAALTLAAKAKPEALIGMLDEVAVGERLFYGQPPTIDDPIFKAIVDQGRAAVEPLLHAMEFDHRWSRSYAIETQFGERARLVTDRELAFEAFADITRFEARIGRSTSDLKTVRAYWEDNKNLTQIGWWFKVLADDHAGTESWRSAARGLICPTAFDLQRSPQSKDLLTLEEAKNVIRAKKNPPLSQLLAKRVHDLLTIPDRKNDSRPNRLYAAMEIAHFLFEWDRRASLDSLRQVTQAVVTHEFDRDGSSIPEFGGSEFAEVIEDRLDLHDVRALDDYALALASSKPDRYFLDATLFEPLVNHLMAPQLDGVANRVFAGPGSKWNVINVIKADIGGLNTGRLVTSPLLELQPWRDQVLAAMQDTTPLGQVQVDSSRMKFFQANGEGSVLGSGWFGLKDPKLPQAGQKIDYRVCDVVACMISDLSGAPACRIYWPLADRDKAIVAETKFLKQISGGIYKRLPPLNDWRIFTGQRTPLTKPAPEPPTVIDAATPRASALEG